METSQAVILPRLKLPMRSRPDEPDCLLPRLRALAYQPIDSENGEIRLVELLPGRYEDVIQMNLHTGKLSKDAYYEALSYAWGTIPSSKRAIVNGCPIPVQESLDLGLRHLRLVDKPRMLWVDALCINQSDVRERSHQVQQMCMIYKSAERVIIWLGEWPDLETCPHSEECRRMWMTWVNIMWDPGFSAGTPYHLCQHALEISKLPWFRRLWIIQEFLLASSEPNIMLGACVTNAIDFLPAITHCLNVILEHRRSTVSERKQAKQLHTHLSMLQVMNRRFSQHGGASLYEYSSLSRYAMATDPRDRIYGLLGISKSHVADPIVPDYSKAWPQVIAEATIVMISEDGLFPYMSDSFTFSSAERLRECDCTPSWILDFSQLIRDVDPGAYNRPHGHKLDPEGIERRRKSLRLSEDFRTLHKHGSYIGTIGCVFTFTMNTVVGGSWDNTIRWASRLYDFYHEVLKPKCIGPFRLYEALAARFQPTDGTGFRTSILGPRDGFLPTFHYVEGSVPSNFAVFLTEQGDVGVTWLRNTLEIRADDILVALFERQMPFVLRPVRGESTYRMINLAYVSGRSHEYSKSYLLSYERTVKVPHDWVYDTAEGCSEYAIV